ncbi:hypothetical protein TNIN_99471 [Trichonephila inaurata madagascariensis]|uniref:Uncharacterized protein n=1 Tax=Trichonephila inaurata madagascariensis TaxID=2747483 RepID=A0A8X7CN69_9ARAC|nr:hypothetical protein TNIN_99471 [Trichonephila inaurata madagascariensis]
MFRNRRIKYERRRIVLDRLIRGKADTPIHVWSHPSSKTELAAERRLEYTADKQERYLVEQNVVVKKEKEYVRE